MTPKTHHGPAAIGGAGRARRYSSPSEEDRTSLQQPAHDDADGAPRCRCRICRRPLAAPASVARELGPHCAAHLAASITQATGYRAAVEVIGGALVAQLDVEGEGHGRAIGR